MKRKRGRVDGEKWQRQKERIFDMEKELRRIWKEYKERERERKHKRKQRTKSKKGNNEKARRIKRKKEIERVVKKS